MTMPSKPLQSMTLNLSCATIDYFMTVLHNTPLPAVESFPHIQAIMAEIARNNEEAAAKESPSEDA